MRECREDVLDDLFIAETRGAVTKACCATVAVAVPTYSTTRMPTRIIAALLSVDSLPFDGLVSSPIVSTVSQPQYTKIETAMPAAKALKLDTSDGLNHEARASCLRGSKGRLHRRTSR